MSNLYHLYKTLPNPNTRGEKVLNELIYIALMHPIRSLPNTKQNYYILPNELQKMNDHLYPDYKLIRSTKDFNQFILKSSFL